MTSTGPSFRSAVFGHLKCNTDQNGWVLELGHTVANYEYLCEQKTDQSDLEQASLEDVTRRLNSLLYSHDMAVLKSGDSVASNINTINTFAKIKGGTIYALFCISISTWYLGKMQALPQDAPIIPQLRNIASHHLRGIKEHCPDLHIKVDYLWDTLMQTDFDHCSTRRLCQVLQDFMEPIRILFISAAPLDASPVRVGAEYNELTNILEKTEFREKFEVQTVTSCQLSDLIPKLEKHRPQILQFSGHGHEKGLWFERSGGTGQLIGKDFLAKLLHDYSKDIRLVILNACFSESLATSITNSIESLISMKGKVRDKDAIIFTKYFYQALGHGRTVKDSFDTAYLCTQEEVQASIGAQFWQKGPGTNTTVPIQAKAPPDLTWGENAPDSRRAIASTTKPSENWSEARTWHLLRKELMMSIMYSAFFLLSLVVALIMGFSFRTLCGPAALAGFSDRGLPLALFESSARAETTGF